MPRSTMGETADKSEEALYSLTLATVPKNTDSPFLQAPLKADESGIHIYRNIMEQIQRFERNLDDEHEVMVKLASFGQSITMAVEHIGYSEPHTLIFHGYMGEQPATLIQHMSQLNFLLLASKREDPEEPKTPIGFDPTRAD